MQTFLLGKSFNLNIQQKAHGTFDCQKKINELIIFQNTARKKSIQVTLSYFVQMNYIKNKALWKAYCIGALR